MTTLQAQFLADDGSGVVWDTVFSGDEAAAIIERDRLELRGFITRMVRCDDEQPEVDDTVLACPECGKGNQYGRNLHCLPRRTWANLRQCSRRPLAR